jgi:hypothetical protein
MIWIALLQSVALTGGTVHTLVPGETPRVATVWIEDRRIRAIGTDLELPVGVERIDVTGKHVVPGLIDGFVNHDPDHDRLYVASGVTLVRDVGNDLARILTERDRDRQSGARERGPGPAIWSAGAVLDGVPPSTTAAIVLATPAQAEEKLPRLFELGLDYVSFHLGLTKPTLAKSIELAHKHGLKIWGPVLTNGSLADAIELRQDGLFHLEGFLPAGKRWEQAKLADLTTQLDKAVSARIAVTPTLSVFAQRLIAPKDNPPELAYLGPFYARSWLSEAELRRSLVNEAYLKTGVAILETQGQLVKALFERGVPLVPGSASPTPWHMPGEALIDELELLKRAGIPSDAVLRLATAGAAAAIGADAQRGTLAAGKVADLVVTERDPSADISNLRQPFAVVLRGRVLDRPALDRMARELADAQQKVRAATLKPLTIPDPELPIGDVVLRGTVETRAFGERVSGENYAVVRRHDGALTYCGRVLTPGAATSPDHWLTCSQTISAEGRLIEFLVEIKAGTRSIRVQGASNAGRIYVERRIDGQFVDNVPVKDHIALVDAGSVTSGLVLGQRRLAGGFKVIFFEDYDPAVGPWELAVDPQGTRLVRAHNGQMKLRFDAQGALSEWLREQGSGVTQTRSLTIQAPDGVGLPPPAVSTKKDAADAEKTRTENSGGGKRGG